jgi:hypothetical protein
MNREFGFSLIERALRISNILHQILKPFCNDGDRHVHQGRMQAMFQSSSLWSQCQPIGGLQ